MHRLNSAPHIKPGSQTYRNGKQTITTLEPLVRHPPSNQPKVIDKRQERWPLVSGPLAWKDKELGIRVGPRRGVVSQAGGLLSGCHCATKDPLSVSLTALKNAHIWSTLVCSAVRLSVCVHLPRTMTCHVCKYQETRDHPHAHSKKHHFNCLQDKKHPKNAVSDNLPSNDKTQPLSLELWNCLTGDTQQTPERWGGACVGFPDPLDVPL